MKRAFRIIQFASHLSIIVIALLLIFIVIKQYWDTRPQPAAISSATQRQATPSEPAGSVIRVPLGKELPLENIDWKRNKKTLILYLSTTCHFCNESAPFYKRLIEKYSNSENVKIIAVLPQTVDEAKAHLDSLGVNVKEIYSSPLASVGVTATPTLLLVNESGIVTEYWRGKLKPDKEIQVQDKLSG